MRLGQGGEKVFASSSKEGIIGKCIYLQLEIG